MTESRSRGKVPCASTGRLWRLQFGLVAVTGSLVLAALIVLGTDAQTRTMDIYWVDVEGGAATLVVAPSGESLLIDALWEIDDRDAKRISAAARQAGLSRIDHFVMSHFHEDHAGGIPALANLIPFVRRYDRGDFIEPPISAGAMLT